MQQACHRFGRRKNVTFNVQRCSRQFLQVMFWRLDAKTSLKKSLIKLIQH
jgi:hypothetical protein